MTQISAAQVKNLREMTGAGMMDCKAALVEVAGDVDAAVDWLRKKGLAKAAKKAGRAASEGLVGLALADGKGVAVEVNSETDFVARNPEFQTMVSRIADVALTVDGDLERLRAAPLDGDTVDGALTALVGRIGENMQLRRAAGLTVSQGVVGGYVHAQVAPGLGKIATLAALESAGDRAVLEGFARQLAMHVAATNPQSISPDDLDPNLIARERAVVADQARQSGKPEAVVEKMIEGRMRKYYEEVCLLSQVFVIDGEARVEKAVAAAAKEAGAPITVTGFLRLALGEGVEKDDTDFAAEVAAAARG